MLATSVPALSRESYENAAKVASLYEGDARFALPTHDQIVDGVSADAQRWLALRQEQGAVDELVIAPPLDPQALSVAALVERINPAGREASIVDDLYLPYKRWHQPTFINRPPQPAVSRVAYADGRWPYTLHNQGYAGWHTGILLDRDMPHHIPGQEPSPDVNRILPITLSQFVVTHALWREAGRPAPVTPDVTRFTQYECALTGGDVQSWPLGVRFGNRFALGAEVGDLDAIPKTPGRFVLAIETQPSV